MKKTAALIALLATTTLQGLAAERPPYPPGQGWVHLRTECARGGTYCPGPFKVDGPPSDYPESHWARDAGKRGKLHYVELITTFGQLDWMRDPEPSLYAVKCEMWESKSLSMRNPQEWETIKPTSLVDRAALLVCK